MSNPLVSAVITTHNRKEMVGAAILSVQKQLYDNIEIIVIDDASQDGTRELLSEKSKKEGFKYVYISPSESKGGNYARNQGILSSLGEYVAFLDDDDEWLPEKIQKQVDFMQVHPECGVVACFNIVEFNGSARFPENRNGMLEGDVHDKIFTGIPFVTSVAMYRRKILVEVGMFDENLRYWQETELNIRVAQVAEFGCVHDELALYRVNNKDINRLTNHLEGWIDAIDYIEKKHNELINNLPKYYLKKHKLLIAQDGLSRSKRVGNHKKKIFFSWNICKLEPNAKNIISLLHSIFVFM
jgi:glycosyltransferase involved in cell wall biosynthesis